MATASTWFFDEVAAAAQRQHEGTDNNAQQQPPARNVLLFYSTRDAHLLFRTFMAHPKQLTKCVLASIHSPKTLTTGEVEDHKAHLLPYVESWRRLYQETPCLPCAAPFDAWEDLEKLLLDATGELENENAPVNVFVTGSFFLIGEILQLVERFQQQQQR